MTWFMLLMGGILMWLGRGALTSIAEPKPLTKREITDMTLGEGVPLLTDFTESRSRLWIVQSASLARMLATLFFVAGGVFILAAIRLALQ